MYQSVLEDAQGHEVAQQPRIELTQHQHCPTCGTCFLYALEKQLHRCQLLDGVDEDIREVMELDMNPQKTVHYIHSLPNGYQVWDGF